MKTKNNSMKIMKTESTANEQERKEAKYKPVTPVILDNVSEDVTLFALQMCVSYSMSAIQH